MVVWFLDKLWLSATSTAGSGGVLGARFHAFAAVRWNRIHWRWKYRARQTGREEERRGEGTRWAFGAEKRTRWASDRSVRGGGFCGAPAGRCAIDADVLSFRGVGSGAASSPLPDIWEEEDANTRIAGCSPTTVALAIFKSRRVSSQVALSLSIRPQFARKRVLLPATASGTCTGDLGGGLSYFACIAAYSRRWLHVDAPNSHSLFLSLPTTNKTHLAILRVPSPLGARF